MNYITYTPEELAADEFFIRWVNEQDTETEAFWQDWLGQHPHQQEVIQEARELVLLMDFQPHPPTEMQVSRMRSKVYERISEVQKPEKLQRWQLFTSPGSGRFPWRQAAASLTGIVVLAGLLWFGFTRFNTVTHHTGYGQTQSVTLPDGSVVTLNANSTLRYSRQWHARKVREVWLDGEGFFNVTHQRTHQPFVVHTGEVEVKVLGTTFNVWQRENHAKVVLVTGKIELRTPKQAAIILKPAELAEVRQAAKITRTQVRPERYTAWKENMLLFDETPLQEVVQLIEDQYGFQVQIKDPALLDQTLTLKLPGNDIDVLLQSLQKLYNLKITKTEGHIRLEKADTFQ